MPKAPARQARVPRWANPALAFLVLMTVLFALSSRRALVGPGGGVGGPVAALQLPATRRSGGVVGSVEALRQVDWKKRGPPAAEVSVREEEELTSAVRASPGPTGEEAKPERAADVESAQPDEGAPQPAPAPFPAAAAAAAAAAAEAVPAAAGPEAAPAGAPGGGAGTGQNPQLPLRRVTFEEAKTMFGLPTETAQQGTLPLDRCGKTVQYLEEPPAEVKDSLQLKCERTDYSDSPDVALVYTGPAAGAVRQLVAQMRGENLDLRVELIVNADMEGLAGGWQQSPFNDFVLYSRGGVQNHDRYNRLVRMANAPLVVLLQGEGLEGVVDWVLEARAVFAAAPAVGAVGSWARSGTADGGLKASASATLEFGFVGSIGCGRVAAFRREAWLEVGGLLECRRRPKYCDDDILALMSFRLWDGGWQVAALPAGATADAAGDAPSAASIDKFYAAKATAARSHFRQHGRGAAPTCPEPSRVAAAYAKDFEDSRCGGAPGKPEISIVVQYFNQPRIIERLMAVLARTKRRHEILINNDSHSEKGAWRAALPGGNHHLLLSPDIHEIRGYNRLGKFAAGDVVAFLQDDDLPRKPAWVDDSLKLFHEHRGMSLLGGFRGRIDNGRNFSLSMHQIEGEKFGPGYKKLVRTDVKTRLPFMYAYKVNSSPLLVRRAAFYAAGMFNRALSCPGLPGIGFDFEYSVRTWFYGTKVGLYYAQFVHSVDGRQHSGTWKNKDAWQARKQNERRNNLALYHMYNGFHHEGGSHHVAAAQAGLPGDWRVKAHLKFRQADYVREGDYIDKKTKKNETGFYEGSWAERQEQAPGRRGGPG